MLAHEDVQRQVTIVAVIPMKIAPFLRAVHGIVGRIQVENDLCGRRGVRLEEEVDEQPIHRVMIDR